MGKLRAQRPRHLLPEGRRQSVRGGRGPHIPVVEAGEINVHEGGQRDSSAFAVCIHYAPWCLLAGGSAASVPGSDSFGDASVKKMHETLSLVFPAFRE